jgi:hypothetical protein
MPVKKIEALADCIAFLNDAHNPDSRAYQLRNPGMCRAFSFKQLNNTTDDGYRIFTSIIGGTRFLHQDLSWKCSGQTRAKGEHGKLKPSSNLTDLLKSFKLSDMGSLMTAVDFLNRALQPDEPITAETKLEFFLEGAGE